MLFAACASLPLREGVDLNKLQVLGDQLITCLPLREGVDLNKLPTADQMERVRSPSA